MLACALFLLILLTKISGQKSLDKFVTIDVVRTELKDVLEMIRSQVGVKFTYSSDVVDVSQNISCHLMKRRLSEFLRLQLLPLGIEYKAIDDEQILLYVSAEQKDDLRNDPGNDKNLIFSSSARVSNENNEPLVGVSVVEKGTGNGTVTNEKGVFSLSVHENATLVLSLIGYQSREIKAGNIRMFNVTLSGASKTIEEVIVTGVFDRRRRNESAVSVTTLSTFDLEKLSPVSGADILNGVPGVYVNSSLGEIRNIVYSRGVSANSTDAASGYYYVSLQEDGLPVTNVTFINFGPDYFYRPDASLKRMEAVRGGTASILGANAPGGIFNFISKTGGDELSGVVNTKYGIEGNGNGFYRIDANIGGPINRRGWYFNTSGFYRYSLGARYPGYPLNFGGQWKGDVLKKHQHGSVRFYAKYLDDHNGWYEFLPAKNFNRPKLAPGVKQTDSYLLPGIKTPFPFRGSSETERFDPRTLVHSTDFSAGQEIEHRLPNQWKLRNNLKFSTKRLDWGSSSLVYPLSLRDKYLYSSLGCVGRTGTFIFRDRISGQVLARSYTPDGDIYQVLESSLPGSGVALDGVMRNVGLVHKATVTEWIDQFIATKKVRKMSITGGVFLARSSVRRKSGTPGVGLSPIKNRPGLLDVTLVDSLGSEYKLTNPMGYSNLGVWSSYVNARQTDLALFFGYTTQLSEKWRFDIGGRIGHISVNGFNVNDIPNAGAVDPNFGGIDGNNATIYDNKYYVPGLNYRFSKLINTLSYSTSLSYKIGNKSVIYGRFAHGEKAPDLGYFFAYDSDIKATSDRPKAQKIEQLEIGYVTVTDRFSIFLTPFYSHLGDVYSLVTFRDTNGEVYFPPTQFNSIRTIGIELESEYFIREGLSIKANMSLQSARANNWKIWIANEPGTQDDELVSYKGKKADNNPDVLVSLAPTYTKDKWYAFLSWKYLGNRPGNVPNTITLRGFSQFDAGFGYTLARHLKCRLNVSNILNSQGVMSWSAPEVKGAALDRQGFTEELLAANPNATFGIISIQPRAYFLTMSYTF